MKRYDQGSIGMREDANGAWCDYEEARAEIERLRRKHEKAWADAQLKAAEIEQLRQLRDTMLKGEVAIRQRDADEINRLRGHINWLNDANDGGRLAINEIERLQDELDAAALEVARLERLVWTPMNAYPEIERLRKELAEKDDYIRTLSRPIGAHSYE